MTRGAPKTLLEGLLNTVLPLASPTIMLKFLDGCQGQGLQL